MIIPIRCMNCGNVIANKWRAYQRRLKMYRGDSKDNSIMYIDGTQTVETPEGKALNDVQLRRMCCRKHFLTHVDLIEKIQIAPLHAHVDLIEKIQIAPVEVSFPLRAHVDVIERYHDRM